MPTNGPPHCCYLKKTANNKQVLELFPSARELNCTWTNVVKVAESLYREGPGLDQYRPDQRTPIPNFFMAGSYTYQVRHPTWLGGDMRVLSLLVGDRRGGEPHAVCTFFYLLWTVGAGCTAQFCVLVGKDSAMCFQTFVVVYVFPLTNSSWIQSVFSCLIMSL